MPQPGFGIDVDVRADARRAGREERTRQRERRGAGVMAARRAIVALVLDAVDEARPDLHCDTTASPVRLVEVRVAFDEAGQRERARAVLDRAAGGRVERRADAHDAIAFDQDVERGVGVRADVADQQVRHVGSGEVGQCGQCEGGTAHAVPPVRSVSA